MKNILKIFIAIVFSILLSSIVKAGSMSEPFDWQTSTDVGATTDKEIGFASAAVTYDLTVGGNISATTYYGDGSNLTGLDTAQNLQQTLDNGNTAATTTANLITLTATDTHSALSLIHGLGSGNVFTISNTGSGRGVNVSTNGAGYSIYAENSGSGHTIYGNNTAAGNGVRGQSNGVGRGVQGESVTTGFGVYGNNSGGGYGVYGNNTSTGTALYGRSQSNTTGKAGYFINSDASNYRPPLTANTIGSGHLFELQEKNKSRLYVDTNGAIYASGTVSAASATFTSTLNVDGAVTFATDSVQIGQYQPIVSSSATETIRLESNIAININPNSATAVVFDFEYADSLTLVMVTPFSAGAATSPNCWVTATATTGFSTKCDATSTVMWFSGGRD